MKINSNSQEKCNQALEVLKDVYDPEIGLNVVDLGLIYRIDFNDAAQVIDVDMTLTTQYCPMGESIVNNVSGSMQQLFATYEINVTLTFEPPWDMEMISEAGKAFLQGY
ncbi:MAG: DUF59 domain-containing protein [Bacteroidetes bacterium]|jgi:metal-sulfur cluster biosynthetic enzyme|nr:DUF59 domain-containing protein [Bacteroidota bacterium]